MDPLEVERFLRYCQRAMPDAFFGYQHTPEGETFEVIYNSYWGAKAECGNIHFCRRLSRYEYEVEFTLKWPECNLYYLQRVLRRFHNIVHEYDANDVAEWCKECQDAVRVHMAAVGLIALANTPSPW